ncbi:DJ-1/PfpI family protein [Pseudonocardia yunnanensis]|uniref:GlxA family transcriptional regulator n=1 Tax=Pseudonocardia yunnanensis TaxID=58107 RepID=A0ABW4ES42_9PSEU
MDPRGPHVVAVVLSPGVDALDVTGPAEVFALATKLLARDGSATGGYDVRFVGEREGLVPTFSGLRLCAEETFASWRRGIDTLLVPGTVEIEADRPVPHTDAAAVEWVRAVGPGAGRVASVCAGAHLTAAAGLLDGYRATTHWGTAAELARYPKVEVLTDPIFVRSGKMWTSAGLMASMDLALALVAEDHGHEVALEVARVMVMYLQRPGGQSQFSAPLAHRPSTRDDLRRLRAWIGEHLAGDLSVTALAQRVAMSPRHFARVFHADTGTTPAAYVERLRLELARRLLEQTDRTAQGIARESGLRSVETLHRVFRDHLGTTPGEYRRRFRPDTAPAGARQPPIGGTVPRG